MKPHRCVDLFRLRTAVAALYSACRRSDDLNTADMVRVNAAVGHLSAVQSDVGGELGAACRALLSPAPDEGGLRRVQAIDRLAELTHVDDDCAAALAAIADHEISFDPRTPSLFDTEADEATGT